MWGKNDPAHAARLADQGLTFGPPPGWVVDQPIPAPDAAADGAVCFLISDTQIDLSQSERAWTSRLVQQPLNREGVSQAAGFSFSFDPSCERAVIHRVRIYRDSEIIDLADADAFQLLRRESNLERRVYDGALTADMQAPDLRPGDVLETWFTTFGSNPVQQGKFEGRFNFGWSAPVKETRVRIRTQASRRLASRSQPENWAGPAYSENETADGLVIREWCGTDVAPFRYDDSTPPWWIGHPRLCIADDLAWSDIADLYLGGYAPSATLPETLEAEIAKIASASEAPAFRAAEALRFVQREVRYLSISMGEGGLVPRSVDEIWKRRFGDCKDVSRLLVEILRRLDIDAVPALVNAQAGGRLNATLPGIYAFNHCIVRARIAGRSWWLDATSGEQGGDLDHLHRPAFGWALPLEAGAVLEETGTGDAPIDLLETRERFIFGKKPDSPAELHVRTIYRDWKADEIRAALRREGLARVQERWLGFYARAYGGAAALMPPEISDDMRVNTLTVEERYRLDKPWTIEKTVARFSSVDDMIRSDLAVLPHPGRNQPLGLGPPRRLKRSSVFEMPKAWGAQPWFDEVDAPGIRGSSSLQTNGRSVLTLETDYAITGHELMPEDFAEFEDGANKLRDGASVTLLNPVRKGEFVKNERTNGFEPNSAGAYGLYFVAALVVARIIIGIAGG